MKNLIVVAVILLLAVSAYSSDPGTQGMQKFPEIWGTNNTNFITKIEPFSSSNWIYKVPGYTWELGTDVGTEQITITCDIEMYLSMALEATDVYFHIANNTTSMSAYINGWLKSNNGMHLFVSSELDTKDLSKLEYITDVLGRDVAYYDANPEKIKPAPIPVSWALKCSSDPDFWEGTYSDGGNAGQLHGIQWLLEDGTAGQHNFVIRINIQPADYQQDGRYEMDPVVTASPVL